MQPWWTCFGKTLSLPACTLKPLSRSRTRLAGNEPCWTALRHVAEARGMAAVAERAGMPRETLYRALSPNGNPTIKTLLAVLGAAGLHLAVTRPTQTL